MLVFVLGFALGAAVVFALGWALAHLDARDWTPRELTSEERRREAEDVVHKLKRRGFSRDEPRRATIGMAAEGGLGGLGKEQQ